MQLQLIAAGRADLILAGGTDAMSQAPLLFNKSMVNWLADWQAAKSPVLARKIIIALTPAFFSANHCVDWWFNRLDCRP